jgi:hypothetical protein
MSNYPEAIIEEAKQISKALDGRLGENPDESQAGSMD